MPEPIATATAELFDTEAFTARVQRVLDDDIYWFPVRHCSPAVARQVERAILARRPRWIFLEAPAGAESMIPHLIDDKTRPPVAIYSSYRDDDNVLGLAGVLSPADDIPARFASWYPLLSYSPELACLKAAQKIDAQVVFMDLPHWALIRPMVDGVSVDDEKPMSTDDTTGRQAEQLMRHSDFYRRLTEIAGYKSWDETWDTYFERRIWTDSASDVEDFRRELACFCAAARLTADPDRLEWDGTLERERFMRRTIAQTLENGRIEASQAMVVCGGFHLFMDHDDTQDPPSTPAGSVYTTVVPYSYPRLAQSAGYAAGNRAPGFYQAGWDQALAGRGSEDLLVKHVLKVVRLARKRGESLSPADSIAVAQHTRLLARLRGRDTPVLDDLRDGLITCCVKGDVEQEGGRLVEAMREVEIGNRVGRVSDAVDLAPIVKDFHEQIRELGLEETQKRDVVMDLRLDLRDDPDAAKSRFFHRLRHLEVPFAEPLETRATGTLFSEHWRLRWSPRIDQTLLEKGLYGDSVEAAATAQLEEEVARQGLNAGACCRRLRDAVDMDLPELIQRLQDVCRSAIDQDSRFLSLAEGFLHLQVPARRNRLRGLSTTVADRLIARIFDRACLALPNAASAPESEEAAVVDGLRSLAERVTDPRLGDEPENDLFTEQVEVAAATSGVPFLRGAFLATLVEIRARPPQTLADEITGFARSAPDELIRAGEFLSGVLKASKASILLGADALIGALDELLRAADPESFLVMLPRLRGAFDQLAPAQLAGFSRRVAETYGLRDVEELDFDTSVEAAAAITAVDARMAEILEAWQL